MPDKPANSPSPTPTPDLTQPITTSSSPRPGAGRPSFSSSVRPAVPNIPPRGSPLVSGSPRASPGGAGYGSIPKPESSYASGKRASVGGGSVSVSVGGGGNGGATSSRVGKKDGTESPSLRGLGEKKDVAATSALLGTSLSKSGLSHALEAAASSRSPPGEPHTSAGGAQAERGRSSHTPKGHSLSASPSTTALPHNARPDVGLRRASSGLAFAASSSAGGTTPRRERDGEPSMGVTSPPHTPNSISDIPDSAKAEIIRRHLVSAQERQAGEAERRGSSAVSRPGHISGVNSPADSGVVLALESGRGTPAEQETAMPPRDATTAAAVASQEDDAVKSRSRSRSENRSRNGGEAADQGSQFENGTSESDRFAVDMPVQGDGQSGVVLGEADEDAFPLPFDAPGGDVTHGIYKWQNAHRPVPTTHRRAQSFSAIPNPRREDSMTRSLDPSLQHLRQLGGFRRQFVQKRAQARGEEVPRMLRSFVDFLFLYGHFAGEDLDEEDDESDTEEADDLAAAGLRLAREESPVTTAARRALSRGPSVLPTHMGGERAPLLGPESRSASKARHKRSRSMGPHGDATVTQAVLMLLKGFVGTGVLFLGKAFFNGGILFSTIVMLAIAGISLWSFLLLVKTRLVIPGGFGEIGGALYGKYMRATILTSIALSQIGFVAAYTIFVAENMQAFILAVTNCRKFVEIKWLILAQLVIFLPLSMIRNLAALSSTALIADAFILVGLIYIGSNEIKVIATKGVADVALFNKDSFSLLIGTAVFAFEGIGLVIPITESMREPHKFPKVLSGVMAVVAVLFASFGVMGYMAYGSDIQTVVIVNLPQDQKFVQVVQCLYSIAILLSAPLQLFPAVRIMEQALFVKSGKHNPQVKWQKNLFRACTVMGCSLISWGGASNLDGFVSIIGSFACIPLCFIYPPLLHLRACAHSKKQRILDYLLLLFGLVAAIYTTLETAKVLVAGKGQGGTQFGKCD